MDEISRRVEEYIERGAGLIRADLLSEARYNLIYPLLGTGMSGPIRAGDRTAAVLGEFSKLFSGNHPNLLRDLKDAGAPMRMMREGI